MTWDVTTTVYDDPTVFNATDCDDAAEIMECYL